MKTRDELLAAAEALEWAARDDVEKGTMMERAREYRAQAAALPAQSLYDMTETDFDAAHHFADAGKMMHMPAQEPVAWGCFHPYGWLNHDLVGTETLEEAVARAAIAVKEKA